MHYPIPVSFNSPSGPGHAAGICAIDTGSGRRNGWYVPVKGDADSRRGVIRILVKDPASTFNKFIDFLIDTGSPATLIPRVLDQDLQRNAFSVSTTRPLRRRVKLISPVAEGRETFGFEYRAQLAIVPSRSDGPWFRFRNVRPVLIDDDHWAGTHAVLGLDALRELITVVDSRHVTLWGETRIEATDIRATDPRRA